MSFLTDLTKMNLLMNSQPQNHSQSIDLHPINLQKTSSSLLKKTFKQKKLHSLLIHTGQLNLHGKHTKTQLQTCMQHSTPPKPQMSQSQTQPTNRPSMAQTLISGGRQ